MTIHWCGTGLSAIPGLRKLIEDGHPVVVWNRTVAKARDALGDERRFFDVDFYDLVKDRVGMVGRIEQHFGLEPTDPALLQGWLDTKRADSRGSHKYDAAMWGLDRDTIHEQFRDYIERFDITLKAAK